jgi:hypothetical protein
MDLEWLKKHERYDSTGETRGFRNYFYKDETMWYCVCIPKRARHGGTYWSTEAGVKDLDELPHWFQTLYKEARKQVERRDRLRKELI